MSAYDPPGPPDSPHQPYGSMPPPPPGGAPVASRDPRTAPSTVVNAVRIMFVLAVLGVVGAIIVFADKSAIRNAVIKNKPSLSSHDVDTAVNVSIAVGGVIALIVVVLYVLLALQVRKGKNWARIVTWVLSGLGALGAISNLTRPQPTISKVVAGVELVVYVVLIVLLAMGPSNDYFRKPAGYYR